MGLFVVSSGDASVPAPAAVPTMEMLMGEYGSFLNSTESILLCCKDTHNLAAEL